MNETAQLCIQIFFDAIIFVIAPLFIKMYADMAEVKTNMSWVMGGLKMLGDKSGVVLHSPHTPGFDALIEKFWHNQLTKDGAAELCKYLEAVIHEDPIHPIIPNTPYSEIQKVTATQMLAGVVTICRVGKCPENNGNGQMKT